MECPKCGFNDHTGGSECPKCGIVYAKHRPGQAGKTQETGKEAVEALPTEEKRDKEKTHCQPHTEFK